MLKNSDVKDEFSTETVCNDNSTEYGFAAADQVFQEAIEYMCSDVCPCKLTENQAEMWDDNLEGKYFGEQYSATSLTTCLPSESPRCDELNSTDLNSNDTDRVLSATDADPTEYCTFDTTNKFLNAYFEEDD